jgi:hypothetical protein
MLPSRDGSLVGSDQTNISTTAYVHDIDVIFVEDTIRSSIYSVSKAWVSSVSSAAVLAVVREWDRPDRGLLDGWKVSPYRSTIHPEGDHPWRSPKRNASIAVVF